MSGVMPVIFASTIVQIFPMITAFMKLEEGNIVLEISKYFNQLYWFNFSDIKYTAGVLIYTASGDSEGSLGGLVRQGLPGKFEVIIQHALNEATWCASDPVCIQSMGQGQDGCNLAACHNCALLPETSCENKNMLLDRGLMIGTLDDQSIGFFKHWNNI